jgi:hypothetical protein
MKRFFRIGLAAQLTFVILMGTGAYVGFLPTGLAAVPHLDWVLHAVFIGGVAFFLDGALGHRPLARGVGSLAGAVVMGVAGFEEWAQRFSSRRSSSWGDFIADAIGIVVLVWLARRLSRSEMAKESAATA